MKNLSLLFLFFCIWCNWLTARFCFHLDFQLYEFFFVLVCLYLLVCACACIYMSVCVCLPLILILLWLNFLDSLLDFFHYILKFLGNYQFKHLFFSLLSGFPISCMLNYLTTWWSVLPASHPFLLFTFQIGNLYWPIFIFSNFFFNSVKSTEWAYQRRSTLLLLFLGVAFHFNIFF